MARESWWGIKAGGGRGHGGDEGWGFPIIGTGCYEGEDKQAATVTPGVC